MTKEQIDELGTLKPEHPVMVTDYISLVAAALPRLLEERKRLLEALRGVMEEVGDPIPNRRCWLDALEAVDFAEEPTAAAS